MKLLLDQNLSWKLVGALEDLFPGSRHVRDLGLDGAGDEAVWEEARAQGFAILSKDSDFEQRSLLLGHPPKCVLLGVGNCSTRQIGRIVRDHAQTILDFGAAEQESYLIIP
jgi:predicted nuclease of predicted toxin-antitoxin system